MKITVYTITDCQYSKQEKEYLASHNLTYEEKNLETNKEFLTEMMALSNNFAGTPVTRVEKDDGTITVLKGFTKEEFDTTFGFAEPSSAPATEDKTPKVEEPVVAEAAPPSQSTPTVETPVVEIPATDTSFSPPVTPNEPKSDELNSILGKLEDKTVPEETPQTETLPTPTDQTNSTDAKPTTPSIPDFPADKPTV